jgi:integrase
MCATLEYVIDLNLGSIEWRGKNKDHARLIVTLASDEKGKRVKVYKNLGRITSDEAATELFRFSTSFCSNSFADKANMTFGQLVNRWKMLCWERNELKPKTRQRYNEILDSRILPVLKDKKLREITTTHIEELLAKIKSGDRKDNRPGRLSSQTVLHHFVLLKTVFLYALECDFIITNPVKKKNRPKVKTTPIKSYSQKETDLLIDALKYTDLQHQAMIRLPLAIGCRLGELAGLHWHDICFETGLVSIKTTRQYIDKISGVIDGSPKTDKSSRECPVPTVVLDLLGRYKTELAETLKYLGRELNESDHVFVNIDGNPIHPSSPNSWLRIFLARHKLKRLSFHGLRHTCASLLLANGIDAAAIAELLGHSTPAITLKTYLHPTSEAMKRIAVTMNDIQKGSD